MADKDTQKGSQTRHATQKALPDAARRALAEAEARRGDAGKDGNGQHRSESGGPKGPDPVRYGDWEFKGRAIDF